MRILVVDDHEVVRQGICTVLGVDPAVDLLEKARAQGHRFDILAKPIKPEHLTQPIRKKYLS